MVAENKKSKKNGIIIDDSVKNRVNMYGRTNRKIKTN